MWERKRNRACSVLECVYIMEQNEAIQPISVEQGVLSFPFLFYKAFKYFSSNAIQIPLEALNKLISTPSADSEFNIIRFTSYLSIYFGQHLKSVSWFLNLQLMEIVSDHSSIRNSPPLSHCLNQLTTMVQW